MADVIAFPDRAERESDRLTVLMRGGRILDDDGRMLVDAASLGTREDWAWTAYSYLQCRQCERSTPVGPGSVEVSIAALSAVLALTEELAIMAGIIPAPGGSA